MSDAASIGDALRRRWFVILLCVIVGAGLGVGAGLQRTPEYSAKAQLTVGALNLSINSIAGFATGGQVLADGFSRTVGQPAVINPAAERLGLSPAYVLKHVTSTPINRTAVFTVDSTGNSSRQALGIANEVADAMRTYAERQLGDQTLTRRLLQRYENVVRDRERQQDTIASLKRRDAPASQISSAQSVYDTLNLRAQTLQAIYSSRQTNAAAGSLISGLSPARIARSDRDDKVQLFGGFGAVGGLILGVLLAWGTGAASNARARRRLRKQLARV